ncbi:glutathione S-transferase, nitrogen catabolite repression regulator [Aspergillus pseudoviridinutans]|uniref:glutathione transferase n=1 Tax=Aspergillus pseudoviridinutans TaxID=1517512 RepID=A0A9P3BQ79_9EURO|nr:glutathione S-transferase, nitrogen catabolite repression regulator [Aspergillus pseudoviridinutans]GIJ92508.1 glutathione S-transferase, nitrogen catabolite repression regulator [Aspergillus pseudoviridinutans]
MPLIPISLWSHSIGANSWKVAMILEELNIPYTHKFIDFPEMKQEPYVSINPNGRVPAIEDSNTGITLWESGAIIEYLVATYDKQNTISFTAGSKEDYQTKQWLYFQVSGQGPYFGQAAWFLRYHSENVPSAIERYINEIKRVLRVLDGALKNKDYLVGDQYTYADAVFVPWFTIMTSFTDEMNLDGKFPSVHAWLTRLKTAPAIAKVLDDWSVASGQKMM